MNDPFAWVRDVDPFVVDSNTQFQSKGPYEVTSGAYAKEYNEVKALGKAGIQRTAEQQALVDFFQANPVELYNRNFRTYALAQGLDLAEQARLFAKFALAGADSIITCWEDKAHWSFWRPLTAIQLGNDDGNPKTEGDSGWTSAIGTPPYPDHSSGYNCNTGSYTEIGESSLRAGTDNVRAGPSERGDPDPHVRALPRRARRHDRRAYLPRNPLPLGRRAGCRDRPRRRPLGRQARTAISEVTRCRNRAVE